MTTASWTGTQLTTQEQANLDSVMTAIEHTMQAFMEGCTYACPDMDFDEFEQAWLLSGTCAALTEDWNIPEAAYLLILDKWRKALATSGVRKKERTKAKRG